MPRKVKTSNWKNEDEWQSHKPGWKKDWSRIFPMYVPSNIWRIHTGKWYLFQYNGNEYIGKNIGPATEYRKLVGTKEFWYKIEVPADAESFRSAIVYNVTKKQLLEELKPLFDEHE